MKNMTEIAERLEDARYVQGLTQTDLGRRIGIGQSGVANYARRPNMYVSTLIDWAAALGLEIVLVPVSVAAAAEEMYR
jgi:transcriptional regulator with XRE-family HTH domain